ncbi:MAG: hypothetical protein AABZ30_04025 [Myxococcota bacterium]
MTTTTLRFAAPFALLGACLSPEPEGIAPSQPAQTTVRMDFSHRPLPEIPLPNDIATRFDASSATGRRINASMVAPTSFERSVRRHLDGLDGWGLFQPIAIPFTGALDVASILAGHRDANYDLSNDVVYLVDVDPDSPEFGAARHLDLGNGNYPVVLEDMDGYWKNDPRGFTLSLFFEEADEDVNGNGELDPGEDTDADGTLDFPNYLPGESPARDDLAGRADALMTFYERETHTLIVRPMKPLRERTTYAVVVTRRLLDADGLPVGSPYAFVNHASQTEDLRPLLGVMPEGLALGDIAFAFTFTTQTVEAEWIAVREGLYGRGPQKRLGEDFSPDIAELFPLRDGEFFQNLGNRYVLPTEDWSEVFGIVLGQFFGAGEETEAYRLTMEAQRYVDFQVMGSFVSPQLLRRTDDDGVTLGLNEQSWPPDLDRSAAAAHPETMHFWLTVPRKEISPRGEGEPAPVVIMGHGYGSNRIEALQYGAFLARHGFATIAIDNFGHGLVLDGPSELGVRALLAGYGLTPWVEALLKSRAVDLDNDTIADSGGDFWTSYAFHTRDVVRQTMLDYMQLVRLLRGFDGERRMAFDVNGDGVGELAGDFDGDGVVDLGGPGVTFAGVGGSLGGITMSLLGSIEPEMAAVTPISGGGGYTDIGLRSLQGGVREAFHLRLMGPLYVGTIATGDTGDAAPGEMLLETIVTDVNSTATFPIATIPDIEPGDTLLVENLANGERGCGVVAADGTVRAAVESDLGDETRLTLYRGDALELGTAECETARGAEARTTIETFGKEIDFQGATFAEGAPLVALQEGLGLRRANPELRRLFSIGQAVMDPADPAVLARHFVHDPLVYPSGERTHTNALIVTTNGDMNVPASSGVTLGRAAGFIEYLEDDPRYGKPANQVLIDTYTAEAVHTLRRYTNAKTGEGVHIDVENFSQGTDLWGEQVPRLDPPLHLWTDRDRDGNALGGFSGAIFPFPIPEGQHGFPFPGVLPDTARKQCVEACAKVDCDCDNIETFDTGAFIFNMLGRYLASGGGEMDIDLCNSRNDCEDFEPPPDPREPAARP